MEIMDFILFAIGVFAVGFCQGVGFFVCYLFISWLGDKFDGK
jgi:hypothetical protein